MRKSALFAFGLVVIGLLTLGLVVLSSAGEANGIRLYKDACFFIKRQGVFAAVGIAVAFFTARFDYRRWRDYPALTVALYGVVMALLLAVFAFPAINGSKRWLPVGPIRLQPSEFAKLVAVIATALLLDKASWRVERFKEGIAYPCLAFGLLAIPVLFEPDFGSVMVIGGIGTLLLFVTGVRMRYFIPALFLGAVGVGAKVALNSNRMARLAAFVGRHSDAATAAAANADPAAYQSNMALVAIHNGGWFGVGLGESMQKQHYLPEAHTDCIFAIGAEELGLIFTIAVIVLYLLFFSLSVYIARKANDRFGKLLVVGMAFVVFFQAMFNLGVVCQALPTKGMALPFFSYGGTNLVASFFAVGTILSVGIVAYRDRNRRKSRFATGVGGAR